MFKCKGIKKFEPPLYYSGKERNLLIKTEDEVQKGSRTEKFGREKMNNLDITGLCVAKRMYESQVNGKGQMNGSRHCYSSLKSAIYNRAMKIHSELSKDGENRQFDQAALTKMMESVISYVSPVRLTIPSPKSVKSLEAVASPAESAKESEENPSEESITNEDSSSNSQPNDAENVASSDGTCEEEEEKRDSAVSGEMQQSEYELDPDGTEIIIIIHVYDETRKIEKDFPCYKKDLAENMGYFANIMMVQDIESFDISIHCDLEVFEWIMKWIRWNKLDTERKANPDTNLENCCTKYEIPELRIYNVLPIISSACFLEMEPLVTTCLYYCHENLSEIIKISPNFNCFDDNVITRLASLFSNNDLDMIVDNDELITPYLWIKLIQDLCRNKTEPDRGHFFNICGIYRCLQCKQIITSCIEHHIPCRRANMRLNRWGQFFYNHVRDPKWDINQFIGQLFNQTLSWRNVYWKLWSYCHLLYCSRCKKYFPINQMNFCKHHPGEITYDETKAHQVYSCCNKPFSRFQVYSESDGCQFRAHAVTLKCDRDIDTFAIIQKMNDLELLFEDPVTLESGKLNALKAEVPLSKLIPKRNFLLPLEATSSSNNKKRKRSSARTSLEKLEPVKAAKQKKATNTKRKESSDSARNSSCECPKPKSHNDADSLNRCWSDNFSIRSNQDYQREFEEKLMKDIMLMVENKLGVKEPSTTVEPSKAGGSFLKLEAEWKKEFHMRFGGEDRLPVESKTPRFRKNSLKID